MNRMTKNAGVVNIMLLLFNQTLFTRTRINNSSEEVKFVMQLKGFVLMGLKQEGVQKLNEPRCLGGASFYSFLGFKPKSVECVGVGALCATPKERVLNRDRQ
jgi:hypothetical protein